MAATGTDEASFTYRVELTLEGGYRLVHPLVGASLRKELRSDLERLRAMLESATPEAPEGPRRDR